MKALSQQIDEVSHKQSHGSVVTALLSSLCRTERTRFELSLTHNFLSVPFTLFCMHSLSYSI